MRAAARLSAAAALLIFAGGLAGQGRGGRGGGAPPAPGPCDRPCLEGFINQYLDALVAHNAFGLPLARKVKFSENDQLLDLGDGLWNVTTDITAFDGNRSSSRAPAARQADRYRESILRSDRAGQRRRRSVP